LLLSAAALPWPVWPALGASPAPEAFMPSRAGVVVSMRLICIPMWTRTFALFNLGHGCDVVLGVLEVVLRRGLDVRWGWMVFQRSSDVRFQSCRGQCSGPQWGRCHLIRLRCEACCMIWWLVVIVWLKCKKILGVM
jgi:hypothetical protein